MNPTNDVLEKRVAEMEGGIAGLAVAAGSAAIQYTILTIAEQGSNIVTIPMLYGGTYTLFKHMFPSLGIDCRFAKDDMLDQTYFLRCGYRDPLADEIYWGPREFLGRHDRR